MKMLFKNRKELRKEHNLLELTPARVHDYELKENGLADVLVPKFKSKLMKKIIPSNRSEFIKANLDDIGTAVWLEIDGSTNVSGIADKLSEKFGEGIEPVHDRLTLFLKQLYSNGFIYFKELKKDSING